MMVFTAKALLMLAVIVVLSHSWSMHCEILRDNVQDALAKPSSANWAAQVVKQVWSLGLPAPFAHDGTALSVCQLQHLVQDPQPIPCYPHERLIARVWLSFQGCS